MDEGVFMVGLAAHTAHGARVSARRASLWHARTSHHLPGEEQPEDYWVYRFLKKQLFFGMGGYG